MPCRERNSPERCGRWRRHFTHVLGREWKHKFDVIVALDRLDERLRPGFAARLSILGDQISHAVSIPRRRCSNAMKKKIVYCQRSGWIRTEGSESTGAERGASDPRRHPAWNRGGVGESRKRNPQEIPRQAERSPAIGGVAK